jgi:hypothetical protein
VTPLLSVESFQNLTIQQGRVTASFHSSASLKNLAFWQIETEKIVILSFFTKKWQTLDFVPTIATCCSEFIFVKKTQKKLFAFDVVQIFCDIFHQNSSC